MDRIRLQQFSHDCPHLYVIRCLWLFLTYSDFLYQRFNVPIWWPLWEDKCWKKSIRYWLDIFCIWFSCWNLPMDYHLGIYDQFTRVKPSTSLRLGNFVHLFVYVPNFPSHNVCPIHVNRKVEQCKLSTSKERRVSPRWENLLNAITHCEISFGMARSMGLQSTKLCWSLHCSMRMIDIWLEKQNSCFIQKYY